VQLPLPFIRFPERIPTPPECITDGVTGRHQSRHRQYHEGRVREAPAGLLQTKAPKAASRSPARQLARSHGRAGWQRFPAGDGPGALPRLRVVRDAGEQLAQLDRGGQLPALFECSTDRRSLGFGDGEHRLSMGPLAVSDKLQLALHSDRREEWLGLLPSQTGTQTTLPGLSRGAKERLSAGLMGGRTVAKTQTLAERRREAIRPSMPAPRTKRLAGSGVVTTDPT
jgi:hypothetical protein